MERATANFDRLTLNLAFNYGGRAENRPGRQEPDARQGRF